MIAVRAYEPADAAAWQTLYRACLLHYGASVQKPEMEAEILAELASPYGLKVDIAWRGDTPVGFTCSARVFPAGDGYALYLKELFVIPEARGTGAGRALMRALAQRGIAMGANSLRWESKEAGALEFYARLGAEDNGKTSFTLPSDSFSTFGLN